MNKDWKKNIILLLASQTVSLFGSALVQYAITWHITLTTQSGIMMTIATICGFLPTFLVSPFAGVWADRYDRKRLIMLSDSMIAISTLVLAILFYMGYGSVWLLFLISIVRAFGSGIQMPAVGAIFPQIVPEDKLTKVNGTYGSIQGMVFLVSPMLSGALMTIAPIETIFFIDVITAAIAVSILLLFLRVPVHAKAMNKQAMSYFTDMREGLSYIRSQDYIKAFFLFCTLFFVLLAPAALLTPLQVARSFGGEIWRLTAIEVVFSIGMMAGGGIIALWGGFKNKIHTLAFATLVTGVCIFALGVVPVFWIYLVFVGATGITVPLFNTPSSVLLQERVEADYLGRVISFLTMISSSMMPLGMLVFGPLADFIAIEWLLMGTGMLVFAQSFFMMGNRALIEAGKPVAKSEPFIAS